MASQGCPETSLASPASSEPDGGTVIARLFSPVLQGWHSAHAAESTDLLSTATQKAPVGSKAPKVEELTGRGPTLMGDQEVSKSQPEARQTQPRGAFAWSFLGRCTEGPVKSTWSLMEQVGRGRGRSGHFLYPESS